MKIRLCPLQKFEPHLECLRPASIVVLIVSFPFYPVMWPTLPEEPKKG